MSSLEPDLRACTYCGSVTPRSSGICTACLHALSCAIRKGYQSGISYIVATSEDAARKVAREQGVELGERVEFENNAVIYAVTSNAGAVRSLDDATTSTSEPYDVTTTCTLHNFDQPKCEPDFPLRTTAWERRNPNQPFYAAIADKKKRRR